MRWILVAVGSWFVIGFSSDVFAAPSADLVFCSKLSDKAERLACFDAAARIADRVSRDELNRSNPRRATANPSPAATNAYAKSANIGPTSQRTAFDGFYAAVGGSWGLMQPINFDRATSTARAFWSCCRRLQSS